MCYIRVKEQYSRIGSRAFIKGKIVNFAGYTGDSPRNITVKKRKLYFRFIEGADQNRFNDSSGPKHQSDKAKY